MRRPQIPERAFARRRNNTYRAERRAALAAAAAAAIDRCGAHLEIHRIAEIAQVGRRSFDACFRDHEDLRQAITDHIADQLIHHVTSVLEPGPETTPRQVAAAMIDIFARWLDQHANMYEYLATRRTDEPLHRIRDALASELTAALHRAGVDQERTDVIAYGIAGYLVCASTRLHHQRLTLRAPRSAHRQRTERLTRVIIAAVGHLLDATAYDLDPPPSR